MRTKELSLIGIAALAHAAGACRSRGDGAPPEAGAVERETTSASLASSVGIYSAGVKMIG